jgi:hypothetical protein
MASGYISGLREIPRRIEISLFGCTYYVNQTYCSTFTIVTPCYKISINTIWTFIFYTQWPEKPVRYRKI